MKYLFLISCMFILSCSTQLDEFEIPFEGDKIILEGSIDKQTGVEIRLDKLLNPNDSFISGDEIYREDVDVFVVVNDSDIFQIPLVEPGRFVLPSEDIAINAGDIAFVKVEKEGEILVESKPVSIPETVLTFEIKDVISTQPQIILGVVTDGVFKLVNFEFQHTISNNKKYFLLSAAAFVEGELATDPEASGYISDYNNQDIELCEINWIYEEYSKSQHSIFSDNCLETGENTLQHYIDLTRGNQNDDRQIDSLSLSLSYVDEAYFQYLNGLNNLGYEFQEPVFFSGNVTGGLGIFYATNNTRLGVGF